EAALDAGDYRSVAVVGGVAASPVLRKRLGELTDRRQIKICLPPLKMSTDNAAMIAAAAWPQFRARGADPLDFGADPAWQLSRAKTGGWAGPRLSERWGAGDGCTVPGDTSAQAPLFVRARRPAFSGPRLRPARRRSGTESRRPPIPHPEYQQTDRDTARRRRRRRDSRIPIHASRPRRPPACPRAAR